MFTPELPGIPAAAWTFIKSMAGATGSATGRAAVKAGVEAFRAATYTAKTDVQVGNELAVYTGRATRRTSTYSGTKRRRTGTDTKVEIENAVGDSLSLVARNSSMGEEKFFDTGQSALFRDGPSVILDSLAYISEPLAQPEVGVGPSQRVGRKIRVIGWELNLELEILPQAWFRGSDPVGTQFSGEMQAHTWRITTVVDQQPNKEELVYGDVFDSVKDVQFQSPNDRFEVDGRSRFAIIMDKQVEMWRTLDPFLLSAPDPTDQQRIFPSVTKFVKYSFPMDFEVSFSETEDITKIVTNDLRLIINKSNDVYVQGGSDYGKCVINSRVWYLN